MARARTEVGTYGKINYTAYADSKRKTAIPGADGKTKGVAVWVASARFRDTDGKRRNVEASGPSKDKAEKALKAKFTERQRTISNGELSTGMRVGAAADYWLTTLANEELSEGTRKLYAGNVERYIKGSTIEHLTLLEVNKVSALEGWLRTIADANGNAAAKGARSVLGNTLALAVRHEVLPHSAMRDTRTPKASAPKEQQRDPDRAFTPAEQATVLAHVDASTTARKADIPDLIHFLAGTGTRINEALTMRWEDVDLDTGETQINGTKTEFSRRVIHLPAWLRERLSDRLERLKALDAETGLELAGTGVVFHSPGTADREKPRNRDNATKMVSRALTAAGFPWATSHTFRHTVVTKIVESHDIGLAADHAGHSDTRTTMAYIGRKRSTKAVADIL